MKRCIEVDFSNLEIEELANVIGDLGSDEIPQLLGLVWDRFQANYDRVKKEDPKVLATWPEWMVQMIVESSETDSSAWKFFEAIHYEYYYQLWKRKIDKYNRPANKLFKITAA